MCGVAQRRCGHVFKSGSNSTAFVFAKNSTTVCTSRQRQSSRATPLTTRISIPQTQTPPCSRAQNRCEPEATERHGGRSWGGWRCQWLLVIWMAKLDPSVWERDTRSHLWLLAAPYTLLRWSTRRNRIGEPLAFVRRWPRVSPQKKLALLPRPGATLLRTWEGGVWRAHGSPRRAHTPARSRTNCREETPSCTNGEGAGNSFEQRD